MIWIASIFGQTYLNTVSPQDSRLMRRIISRDNSESHDRLVKRDCCSQVLHGQIHFVCEIRRDRFKYGSHFSLPIFIFASVARSKAARLRRTILLTRTFAAYATVFMLKFCICYECDITPHLIACNRTNEHRALKFEAKTPPKFLELCHAYANNSSPSTANAIECAGPRLV